MVKKRAKKGSKKSSVRSIYGMIKKDPKDMFFTMLFDLCFVAFVVILSKVWTAIIPEQNSPLFRDFAIKYGGYVLVGLIVSYFLMMLVYSLTKYLTLYRISKYFSKTKLSMKRFWSFFALNIISVLLFFLALVMIVILLGMSVKTDILVFFRLIFLILVGAITYSFFNSLHSYFQQGKSSSESVRLALGTVFRRPKRILIVLFSLIISFIIAAGLLFLLDLLLKRLLLLTIGVPYYIYYWVLALLAFLAISKVVAFHRIFVYARIKEAK